MRFFLIIKGWILDLFGGLKLMITIQRNYNLFLIRSEETRTVTFMSAIKKIQNVGSKIHGIIINDLDTSKDSYYSYYYNYSPSYYNYYSNKNS